MKKKQYLLNVAWIIVAVCVTVFFITAVTVYVTDKPSNSSDLLSRNETWLNTTKLSAMTGDLEEYPYVTKVYRHFSYEECLVINNKIDPNDAEINYGVIEDESLSCNYLVECYVYSDIADKELVRQMWNITVEESNGLILTKNNKLNFVSDVLYNDLKKHFSKNPRYYTTFMRITAKPGMNNIEFNDAFDETIR